MATNVKVQLEQRGPATSEAQVRQHRVLVDRPEAKGGEDRGPMGGELLLASLGGCFMSTLLAAIRAREADISQVTVEVVGQLDGTPPRFTKLELRVGAAYRDRALMEKLVTISERSCIVANTIKHAVDLKLEVLESVLSS